MDGTLRKMNIIQRFWMRDIADHALFVRKNLTVEQLKEAERALHYHQEFQALDKLAQEEELDLKKVRPLVIDFVNFSNELLLSQLTEQMVANDYPAFRDHLVKENQYYLKLISEEIPEEMDNREILYELIFWLRQTFEHTMFIMHWADPYEFEPIKKAQDFAQRFSYLLNKARLLVSMMSLEPVPEIPSSVGTLNSFTQAAVKPIPSLMYLVRQSLTLIEEYKSHLLSVRPMVHEVQSLGILSTRFVDHQTREAGYFIAVLKYILTKDTSAFETEYSQMPFGEEYINDFY